MQILEISKVTAEKKHLKEEKELLNHNRLTAKELANLVIDISLSGVGETSHYWYKKL